MELKDFFALHPKAALAFSGGVDSAYLLYAGLACGADIRAYYVKSGFQPEFEQRDAERLAAELGAEMTVIHLDVLAEPQIASNPINRCYYCKRAIIGAIRERAEKDGYDIILDGTNASDDAQNRPGMAALRERGVLSPLRQCALTKPEIRRLSRAAGLFTWDKPAYACLATRIPAGEEITAEKLINIESAENRLFNMGFKDFRVRLRSGSALLQFVSEELPRAIERSVEIEDALAQYFEQTNIDTSERKKGL